MVGGGKWTRQNKTLPGAYANFISNKKDNRSSDKKNNDTSSVLGIAVLGKMILST